MEKFYYEIPSIKRKNEAIEYINEFYEYKSNINGTGGLQRFLDNYEGWLEKLEEDYKRIPNEEKVPARTYFLIRSNDDKIIGMINIRLALNEHLKKFGGNIGYSIRPTERGKGYNKINLYLGLKICKEYEIEKVLMDADKENPASWRTMEALNGVNVREYYDYENAHCIVKDYEINVNDSIEKNYKIYEPMIQKIALRKYSEKDYQFVYEVKKDAYKKYVEECWGKWNEQEQQAYFKNFIKQVKENAYIIKYEDRNVGFYNGELLKDGNYEIGNICIMPEYQHKGIGTEILNHIIKKYSNRDIEIQYFKQNPVGRLYKKLGFEEVGETQYHYQMIRPKIDKANTRRY